MLPERTVRVLDRVAGKGGRSGLINRAVTTYLGQVSRARLATELKEGYLRDAEHDLAIAEEWFPLDNEAWRRGRRG